MDCYSIGRENLFCYASLMSAETVLGVAFHNHLIGCGSHRRCGLAAWLGDNGASRTMQEPINTMARKFGQPAFHYRTLDTTMRVASEQARNGCCEGTIVTAEQQTAGRGRHGRNWLSEPGQGLYVSLVLRPACSPASAPLLTLVAGLGVWEALERTAPVRCDIRWPNDILIGERKCCGILVEMETERQHVSHVVVGIGINLNQTEFPPALRATATSLRIETGRAWSREAVLQPLLESLESCYDLYRRGGAHPILEAFQQASSYASGRRVIVESLPTDGSSRLRGVTAGLDSNGLLLLRDDAGTVSPILAGSVRPDPGTIEEHAAGG